MGGETRGSGCVFEKMPPAESAGEGGLGGEDVGRSIESSLNVVRPRGAASVGPGVKDSFLVRDLDSFGEATESPTIIGCKRDFEFSPLARLERSGSVNLSV